MFKPAALVRSLFVAATLASLVACTFDDQTPEEEKGSSSALHGKRGADASADDDNSADASAPVKGHHDGGVSPGADGGTGWGDADGGVGDDDVDGGAWGDDDDDSWGADGGTAWGTDAG